MFHFYIRFLKLFFFEMFSQMLCILMRYFVGIFLVLLSMLCIGFRMGKVVFKSVTPPVQKSGKVFNFPFPWSGGLLRMTLGIQFFDYEFLLFHYLIFFFLFMTTITIFWKQASLLVHVCVCVCRCNCVWKSREFFLYICGAPILSFKYSSSAN